MHIGIAATFPGPGISGGRLHAWLLSAALARRGHDVTFVCDQPPQFLSLLPSIPGAERVEHRKLRFGLLRGAGAFRPDLWIVVQERSLNARFFQPVFEQIERHGIPILGLVFETPNWQASVLPRFHHGMLDSMLAEFSRLRAHVLCSTRTGLGWARQYWPDLPASHFHQANPPVLAGLFPEEEARDPDLLVTITRHRNPHKGFGLLSGLAGRDLNGKRLVILDSSAVGLESAYYLDLLGRAGGLRFELRQQVTEREKFSLLKRARALLFPSMFEGFGLPPAEAGYWGTPTVCCDLPVLREVFGDELRYAVPTREAFAQAVVDELKTAGDFSPKPAARRIGDLDRWADEIDAIVRTVAAAGSRPPPRLRAASNPGQVACGAVIVDQLQNWNRDDSLAALGGAIVGSATVSFEHEMAERWGMDCRARGYAGGDLVRVEGNPDEGLRDKLLQAIQSLDERYVVLTEDLLVLPGELIADAVNGLESSGAAGAAFPVRYSHQAAGPHHFRTEQGRLLALCGVFRREALAEVLGSTAAPGSRMQPVLDVSYLLLQGGHRLIPAPGWAERIPPRDRHLLWEVLPGGRGSWQGLADIDPIGAIPCGASDDDEELALLTSLRRRGLELLGQLGHKFASRALIEGLACDLPRASSFWRMHADAARPLESVVQLRSNFPNLSRCFFSRSVLMRYTDMWGLLNSGDLHNPWRTDITIEP